jgi:hypothetical protein
MCGLIPQWLDVAGGIGAVADLYLVRARFIGQPLQKLLCPSD